MIATPKFPGAVKNPDVSSNHIRDTRLDGELENRLFVGTALDGKPSRIELPFFGNWTTAIQLGVDLSQCHPKVSRMAHPHSVV